MSDYLSTQTAAAGEDARLLRAWAVRLEQALMAGDTGRAATIARSCAALALSVAARSESVCAYRLGRAEAPEPPPVELEVRDAPPRRAPGRVAALHECDGERLTVREIAQRRGVTQATIYHRLRHGAAL